MVHPSSTGWRNELIRKEQTMTKTMALSTPFRQVESCRLWPATASATSMTVMAR